MNQFKNGTLLIVIGTAITAVLILMTARDTSSNLQNKDTQIVDANKASTQEISTVEVMTTNVELDTDTSEQTESVQQVITSEAKSEDVTAPEGPFSKIEDTLVDNEANKAEKITKQAAYIQPTIVVATTINNEVPEKTSQPIWMDQKLGEFMSVEKRDAVFKIMPTSPNGLQGEDPKLVVTSKNDKFAPTTILDNYNYQQMPMYNGGYYIAPMPSYFMPSMLPGNPTNKK